MTDTIGRGSALTAVAILALLACLLAAPAPSHGTGDEGLLAAGETAPGFEAVDLQGNPFAFSEALGEGPVFLVFWSIF